MNSFCFRNSIMEEFKSPFGVVFFLFEGEVLKGISKEKACWGDKQLWE